MRKVPTYIKDNCKNVVEKEYLHLEIKSSREELFDIYYFGELFQVDG